MAAGIWSRSSIKEFFRDDPERMAICRWAYQVQRTGEKGPRAVCEPPGCWPVLPIRNPDYRKDAIANMLLWLLAAEFPAEDIYISIRLERELAESGLRWYVYTEQPPLVDAVCEICGQIVRVPAGRACWLCDDCADGWPVIGEVDCERLSDCQETIGDRAAAAGGGLSLSSDGARGDGQGDR